MASTYLLGRRCPLCDHKIPDKHPSDFCCGARIPGGLTIEFRTAPNVDRPERLQLTHTKVLRGGRRYAGKGEDGRRVVLDTINS